MLPHPATSPAGPSNTTFIAGIEAHALPDDVLQEIVLRGARALAKRPQPGCCEPDKLYRASPDVRRARLRELLQCAHELLRREAIAQTIGKRTIDSPAALKDLLALHFQMHDAEAFAVVYLNAQYAVLGIEELFRGTLSQTSVYPREVVKRALAHNAGGVVLAHNHPSGSPEPSRADEFLTQSLKSALGLVDIRVVDHIVVGAGRCVSMAERGLL
ncbi:MAG: DNA repair protein RadC [Rubrivivax sp.]|nr:DNA repair protein RadC [Rubrivivax sp.]